MNEKKCPGGYRGPVPTYLKEITVNGRRLRAGMLFWVKQGTRLNVRGGQYRFLYAEVCRDITFVWGEGPLARKNQRRVCIHPEDIATVHSKSEARE